ncbi:hypothetical protein EXN32_23150 [Agrobacterium tumefaciens]|nr:hypothetical protein EXN32_23150 [Agrobacterium tumefaciens]
MATVSACRLFFRLFRIDTRDKSAAADIDGQSSNARSRHQISSHGKPGGWRRIGIVTDMRRVFRIVLRGIGRQTAWVFPSFFMRAAKECQVQGCEEAKVSIILARRGKASPKKPLV